MIDTCARAMVCPWHTRGREYSGSEIFRASVEKQGVLLSHTPNFVMGVSASCPCRRGSPAAPPHTLDDASSAEGPVDAVAHADASSAGDYIRAMAGLLVAPVDLSGDLALMGMATNTNSHVRSRAAGPVTPRLAPHADGSKLTGIFLQPAAVVRRISKELAELRNNLPCTPGSRIFVRYDKKRPYFMKVGRGRVRWGMCPPLARWPRVWLRGRCCAEHMVICALAVE